MFPRPWLVSGRSVAGVGIGPETEPLSAGIGAGVMMGADFNGEGRPVVAGPGFTGLAFSDFVSLPGEAGSGDTVRTPGTAADALTPGSTDGGPDVAGAAGAGGAGVLFTGEAVPPVGELAGAGGIGLTVGGTEIVSGVTAGCAVASGVCGGTDVEGAGVIEGCAGVPAGIGCEPTSFGAGCRGAAGVVTAGVPCPVAVSFGVALPAAMGACLLTNGDSFESAADFVAGGFSATFSGAS